MQMDELTAGAIKVIVGGLIMAFGGVVTEYYRYLRSRGKDKAAHDLAVAQKEAERTIAGFERSLAIAQEVMLELRKEKAAVVDELRGKIVDCSRCEAALATVTERVAHLEAEAREQSAEIEELKQQLAAATAPRGRRQPPPTA